MINFFRFALLEENDGRIAMPAVIPDLAHERLALLTDEHTAVVDMPGMEVDPPTAVGASNTHIRLPSADPLRTVVFAGGFRTPHDETVDCADTAVAVGACGACSLTHG